MAGTLRVHRLLHLSPGGFLDPIPLPGDRRRARGARDRRTRVVSHEIFSALQKAAQAKNAFDLMGGTDEESLKAEIRLGRDLAAALLEKVALVEENETTRFAAQIGAWLAGNIQEKKLPFTVRVTAERRPDAFALPGGPVFVSWTLLDLCQGERDEIAFVIGHEMGHIVRRHALNRIIKDAALSLLLRQTSGRHAASAWLPGLPCGLRLHA